MTAVPNTTTARRTVRLDGEVVRAHQATVWRFLRFLGCPADAAEDLTQETLLALLDGNVEDRGPVELDRWLRAVARNLVSARRRALRRGLETLDPEQIEAGWASYARHDQGEDYREALRRCLDGLEPRARRALELRYADGADRREVGTELGVSEEGVKSLLRRAKERLRTCIARRLDDDRP